MKRVKRSSKRAKIHGDVGKPKAKAVESTPRLLADYWKHQQQQRVWRMARSAPAKARRAIEIKCSAADEAEERALGPELGLVLKPMPTRAGGWEEADEGWLSTMLEEIEIRRTHYWRKHGKGFKAEETPWVWAEFDVQIAPHRSKGLFVAQAKGEGVLARVFLQRACRFAVSLAEFETGGMAVEASYIHPKPWASHVQLVVSGFTDPVPRPDGKTVRAGARTMACLKVGGLGLSANRLFSFLGKSLLGARAQAKMGFDLARLTGIKDPVAGIEQAISRKSAKAGPLDQRFRDKLDDWVEAELKKPEFHPLSPHMDEGEALYRARIDEQLAYIAKEEENDELRARVANLERQLRARSYAILAAPGKNQAITPAEWTEEMMIDCLYEAAEALLSGDSDLTSLQPWKREIVEIKPAMRQKRNSAGLLVKGPSGAPEMETNPFAGMIGLTVVAYWEAKRRNFDQAILVGGMLTRGEGLSDLPLIPFPAGQPASVSATTR